MQHISKTHSQRPIHLFPHGNSGPIEVTLQWDLGAGWSSPVARQAHNLKVTGSNPVPATILICNASTVTPAEAFCVFAPAHSDSIDASSPRRSIATFSTSVASAADASDRIATTFHRCTEHRHSLPEAFRANPSLIGSSDQMPAGRRLFAIRTTAPE
jgi:hypothetical protein